MSDGARSATSPPQGGRRGGSWVVPEHTGSRATRIIGALTLAGFAAMLVLALVVSPPDQVQGDAARLIYLHVPVAVAMNLGFGLNALGSAMWLWKKSRGWDTLAVAAAEIGLVFTALTLLTGMIWGRPTWGVYWTWDARLTSFSLLFLMYLGYLVVRRLPADIEVRNRRSAYVALLSFVDVPIVYFSVTWWRSLHQSATLSLNTTISGSMLFTLFVSIAVFVGCFAWLLLHRFRVAWLEDEVETKGLDLAISERRAEAMAP